MADIPQSARDAAYAARYGEPVDTYAWGRVADAVLEAAAPLLAEATLAPLAKRHAMVASDWGYHCGTCWVKGNSRAAWPCAELLAIAEILPAASAPVTPEGNP